MSYPTALRRVVVDNYATFSGRASRSEYWWWQLTTMVGSWMLLIVLVASLANELVGPVFVLFGLGGLALLLPSLAVLVRRLHDLGYSGWLVLLTLVPIASLVVLIFTLLPSQPIENRYGPVPTNT